jgi:hypothetical protein
MVNRPNDSTKVYVTQWTLYSQDSGSAIPPGEYLAKDVPDLVFELGTYKLVKSTTSVPKPTKNEKSN